MLAGLDAALILLGVAAPVTADRLPEVHGMAMTLGFVGTLVCLERAVALARPVGFLAPGLLGAGSLFMLTPLPLAVGRVALVLGMLGMCAIYVPLWRRQRDDAVLVQALGSVLGLGAATMWLGGLEIAPMLPWLAGFLVLTVAGERLELARLAMGPAAGPTLVLLSTAVLAATVASLLWPVAGCPLLGLRAGGTHRLAAAPRRGVADDPSRRRDPVHGRRHAGRLLLAADRRKHLGAPRTGTRGGGLRRGHPRHLPRLHDFDDHGPCAGDPARRAAPTVALPPDAVAPARAAARVTRTASVARRLAGGRNRLAGRRRPQRRGAAAVLRPRRILVLVNGPRRGHLTVRERAA